MYPKSQYNRENLTILPCFSALSPSVPSLRAYQLRKKDRPRQPVQKIVWTTYFLSCPQPPVRLPDTASLDRDIDHGRLDL